MNKDEALRMALEAFEEIDGINTETECISIDVDDVIKVIKEALAQPKKEQGEPVNDPAEYDDYDAAVRRNEGKA